MADPRHYEIAVIGKKARKYWKLPGRNSG